MFERDRRLFHQILNGIELRVERLGGAARARWRTCCRTATIASGLWLSAVAAPASAQGLSWGGNGHSLWYYPGSYEQQMALLRDLGASWYRVDLHPDRSPTDLLVQENLARLIAAANAYGIQLLVTISPWITDIDAETEESYYQKSYGYARALAQSFSADIHVWELDNEVEPYAMIRPCETADDGSVWDCRWGDAPGTDPLNYVAARYNRVRGDIRGLSDGIASVDPTAKRVVNMSWPSHYGFLQRLITDGVGFEISAPHWYVMDSTTADLTNFGGINVVAQLRALGNPIWFTEFDRWEGSFGDNEALQGEVVGQMAQQFCAIAPTYGIEAAFHYELQDEPYLGPQTFEAFMGLIRMVPDPLDDWTYGDPKPAYYAFKGVATGCQPL